MNKRTVVKRGGRPRWSLAQRVLYQWARRKRGPREIAARLGCTPRRVRQIIAEYRPLAEELVA